MDGPRDDSPTVVLVGSGPAAVAVARPLVDAGLPLLWLGGDDGGSTAFDGGFDDLPAAAATPGGLRQLQLGSGFESLAEAPGDSPKFRVPHFAAVFQRHRGSPETRGFAHVGADVVGGLSNFWGAMTPAFEATELGLPASDWDELAAACREIAGEIGVSGSNDDALADHQGAGLAGQPPLDLDPTAAALFARHEAWRARHGAGDVRLGRPRQAVLSRDRSDEGAAAARAGCTLCQLCLWGCPRGSIYSARFDVAALAGRPGVRWQPGARVLRLRRAGDAGYRIDYRTGEGKVEGCTAGRVILAAGTVGSTALLLDLLDRPDAVVPLKTTPAFAFAALVPRRIGSPPPARAFGMAQLAWWVDGAALASVAPDHEPAADVMGALYAAHALPLFELMKVLPFSRPGARRLATLLSPGLLLGNGFLSSAYSASTARLHRHGAELPPTLTIDGHHRPEAAVAVRRTVALLRRRLLRWGALVIPGSAIAAQPGSDVHYGGTLPMRGVPAAAAGDAALGVDGLGRPAGLDGLHLVDGSVLPRLSSKHPTLTVMANARRIGRRLAQAWTRDAA